MKRDLFGPRKATGKRIIFRPTITLSNGRVLHARDYGLKAWPIPIG